MKCPKCSYLSFEPELRCKHCGYDFSLAEPNLPIRAFDELEQQDPDLPMVDLQLRPAETEARPAPTLGLIRPRPEPEPAPAPRRGAAAVAVVDRGGAPAPRPAPTPLAARRVPVAVPAAVATPADLPLFIAKSVPAKNLDEAAATAIDDSDEPAVQVPAAPRPLVVRRRAPDSGRQASSAAIAVAPALAVNRADRDLLEYLRRVETEAAPAAFPIAPAARAGPVTAATRLQAAAIDGLVLAALNVTVIWMTLRQCDLGVTQWARVPALPLTTFLVSLSLAYLLVFTVMGGQTIGKMVCGLRVVGEVGATPTMQQMSCRALLAVPSVLALGLGLLPALVGHHGLAVHDRLTHTRVVRV